ncbi:MAG TPA: TonB-dependent receptor, partial [Opitutaceae bacterium]|nr:TonB-dependent receptor [Opitutaceae bacterium]
IKGPAAMIFGQAASLGGLINYVSRRPTRTHQAEVKAAVGSFDYYRGEAHVSGPLTSTLRYRADVGLTDSDWSDRRFGFYKDNFIGGGIEYDIGPKTMLTVDGYVTQVDYYYPTTMMDPVTNQLLAQSRDFTIDDDFAFHNTYQRRVTATLVSQLSDSVQLRLFGAYNSSGNDWLRPYALSLAADNATLSRITESFITDPYFSNFQSDLLWSFDTGPLAHKFSLGGDARFTVDGYTNESFALAPINIRNPVYGAVPSTVPGSGAGGYVDYYKADITTSSVYVQDQIDLFSSRVSLIAGARYNNFKQISRNPRAATVVNNLQRDDKIVHRFGALYHPVRNTTIYVNNSQSFTFNFGRDTITGAPFVPSVGEVKEVGVKGEFFDGALSLSAAYFDMKLTNVRVQFTQGPNDPTPGGQGIRQTGTERNEGFE